jgi:hypothetical protein
MALPTVAVKAPKPPSKATKPSAKPAENGPVGSFEELLQLDPKDVKKIRVAPAAEKKEPPPEN